MRTIPVTGAAGFTGSKVCEFLLAGSARISRTTIRLTRSVQVALSAASESVLHQFYIERGASVPLLHESWKFSVCKFVAVSTVCAYPKFTPVPFREEDL